MTNSINLVVISGELTWVKRKYLKTGKVYMSCCLKQVDMTFDKGEMISRSYSDYYFTCFDRTQWMHNRLRIGRYITVQGYLNPLILKNNISCLTIVAEKIDIHENTKAEK